MALVLVVAPVSAAAGDGLRVVSRLVDPSPVPYASTSLGRATHRVHVSLTNGGDQAATIAGAGVRFQATRAGVAFPCEAREPGSLRWPTSLEPHGVIAAEQDVTCETPLPGEYEVTALVSAPTGELGRSHFPLTISGGKNAPLMLPWDPTGWASTMVSREVPPSKGPTTQARVVLALVNGSSEPKSFGVHVVGVRTRLRSAGKLACPEQQVVLEPRGAVAPGRVHWTWLPLACDLSQEGFYDVDVSLGREGQAPIAVGSHVLRVAVAPPQRVLPTEPGLLTPPR